MADAPDPVPGPTTGGEDTRAGFVAILGAPNAGKSTLVNALVGSKVSIVSPKVQTTRMRVLGIRIVDGSQLVLVDTPGIFFKPRRRLDRAMVQAAWKGAADADRVCLVIDVTRRDDGESQRIADGLRAAGRRADLVLNKIDLVKRDRLLAITQRWYAEQVFDEVFMVSALTGDGVERLLAHLAAAMPPGPWLYPEDQLADMPLRLLAAEITREQVYLQLHDELPYDMAVETDLWREYADGEVKLVQTVYVARDSQRAIVLGHGGRRIRQIGIAARAELAHLLERVVHLSLHVKVRAGWEEDRARYREIGLDYDV